MYHYYKRLVSWCGPVADSPFFLDINSISLESQPIPKPDWLKVRVRYNSAFIETQKTLSKMSMHTVCEEAKCPNISECWQNKHATVMILGATCTRGCAFCNVNTGVPKAVDQNEPNNIASMVEAMGLKHVVITSVDRDDLPDGGAGHFVKCIERIRDTSPDSTIEVLTPDFINKGDSYQLVVNAKPDVYNHNLETVARLYPRMKQGGGIFIR